MTFQWFVAAAALILALGAWVQARRAARRVADLSQAYWELRYQFEELSLEARRRAEAAPAPSPNAAGGHTERADADAPSRAGVTSSNRMAGSAPAGRTPPSDSPSTTHHERAQAFVPLASLKR